MEDVEHHTWARTIWERMDRDGNEKLTASELNCDEFRQALRRAMGAADIEGHAVTYARSTMHIDSLIELCFKKANQNVIVGTLTFHEFRNFMRILRNPEDGKNPAKLIFALFDLD